MRKKILFFIALMVLSAAMVRAQVTTSEITGVVAGAKNEPVEGATITVTHVSSGTISRTTSQKQGTYILQGLRPGGPYKIDVSHVGFDTQSFGDVYLALGEPYRLNVTLLSGDGVQLETVVVTGARRSTILNSDRTGASTNINNRTLSRMPTVSRSITDFTRLTPQANGNGFAGRDGRYNNLQIDGANFNNGFGISSNPVPGGDNQPISLDAIEEMTVNIAPYDVRQTGFTGAGINAVTRSGTNNIEGSAYAFFRPKSFTGLNIGDFKRPANSRTDSRIIGARIGLPIIKDKLFFFGSFESENKNSSGNNWLAKRTAADTTANFTRVLASDLDAVSNYLKSNYGYDPGAYENYANTYNNQNNKILARIDWNINDNNKFNIRFNTMTGTSQQGTNNNSGPNPRSSVNRISSESISFENANYSFKNTVTSLTAELNSRLSTSVSNQFLATWSRIQDTRSTPGSLFPFVDIWKDGKNYITFGTELFSFDNDVINNNVSITDNVTYIKGTHTFTGGVNFQTMSYGNSYKRMGTSYYRYNSLDNFLAGGAPNVFGVTYPYQGNDGYAKVKFATTGAYVQDKISITPNFHLTAGLRADMQLFLNDPVHNPVVDTLKLLDANGNQTTYSTAFWPKSTPLLSPRIGFNYDIFGNKTLQLRGGTGIFTGNIPFVWFTNMPTNSGMLQNTFEPVGATTLAKITKLEADPFYWVNKLPGDFPSTPSTRAPGSLALIDRDFKMPQVWRSSLGADWKIAGLPLIVTADLIYSKDINSIYQFNANRKPATLQLNNAGDNRDLWVNSASATYNSATGSIIPVLSNTNNGQSMAATIGLTLTEIRGLSGSLFYTYSSAEDISGNPGSSAGSAWSNNYSVNDPNELLLGYSQYAVPHRVVGNLSYHVEYLNHLGTTFSIFYSGSHQARFAYVYANDVNRDGVSLDLLYVPNNSSDLKFADITGTGGTVLFTAAQQAAALETFINNSKELSKAKGGYAKRNNGLLPWYSNVDVRLLQDIFVRNNNNRKHTLQLSLDVLNIGNLFNKNWGALHELNLGNTYAYGLLRMTSIDANNVPTFQMSTVNGQLPTTPFRKMTEATSSTWGMQVGIRYIF